MKCVECGAEVTAASGELCEDCKDRAHRKAGPPRPEPAPQKRPPDMEPPRFRPWVNRRGG